MTDAHAQQPRRKISREELNIKIEAARLRILTDSKQKKGTPEWVLRLASRPTYPGELWEPPSERTWRQELRRWWSGRI